MTDWRDQKATEPQRRDARKAAKTLHLCYCVRKLVGDFRLGRSTHASILACLSAAEDVEAIISDERKRARS